MKYFFIILSIIFLLILGIMIVLKVLNINSQFANKLVDKKIIEKWLKNKNVIELTAFDWSIRWLILALLFIIITIVFLINLFIDYLI